MAGQELPSPLDQPIGLSYPRLFGLTFVGFFILTSLFERVPEIGLDIDLKPFFLPLTLLALYPRTEQGWVIGFAVASAELAGDFFEPGGIEPDDPIGFFGYLVGALIASAVIRGRYHSLLWLSLGGVIYALINGLMEVIAWLALGEFADSLVLSFLGNLLAHGLLAGSLLAWPLARLSATRLNIWLRSGSDI